MATITYFSHLTIVFYEPLLYVHTFDVPSANATYILKCKDFSQDIKSVFNKCQINWHSYLIRYFLQLNNSDVNQYFLKKDSKKKYLFCQIIYSGSDPLFLIDSMNQSSGRGSNVFPCHRRLRQYDLTSELLSADYIQSQSINVYVNFLLNEVIPFNVLRVGECLKCMYVFMRTIIYNFILCMIYLKHFSRIWTIIVW